MFSAHSMSCKKAKECVRIEKIYGVFKTDANVSSDEMCREEICGTKIKQRISGRRIASFADGVLKTAANVSSDKMCREEICGTKIKKG